MTNHKDYLKPENIDKLYLIKLKNSSVLPAYVEEVRINGVEQICFTYYEDFECYVEKDIEEVLQELPEDFTDNCDSCNDGKIDIHKALNGETTCDNCKQRQQGLIKFKTTLPNVYKYNSIEELQELYKLLDCPIPNGVDKDWNTQTLIADDLKHSFGLVYTWSHWDDFQDYLLDYCAVIDGGIMVLKDFKVEFDKITCDKPDYTDKELNVLRGVGYTIGYEVAQREFFRFGAEHLKEELNFFKKSMIEERVGFFEGYEDFTSSLESKDEWWSVE